MGIPALAPVIPAQVTHAALYGGNVSDEESDDEFAETTNLQGGITAHPRSYMCAPVTTSNKYSTLSSHDEL